MELIERIEQQMAATQLPLFAITLAAVPCPDTPVILTLHWHAFVRERLADIEGADTVAYKPVPSSALQLNERWEDVLTVDRAALEAAWELGAWDVARAERPSVTRPEPSRAKRSSVCRPSVRFPSAWTATKSWCRMRPIPTSLLNVAARRGYLMWMFRPVHGGIWKDVADDATLRADGTREPPCPVEPVRPAGRRHAQDGLSIRKGGAHRTLSGCAAARLRGDSASRLTNPYSELRRQSQLPNGASPPS